MVLFAYGVFYTYPLRPLSNRRHLQKNKTTSGWKGEFDREGLRPSPQATPLYYINNS
jgi:hypothetical protein